MRKTANRLFPIVLGVLLCSTPLAECADDSIAACVFTNVFIPKGNLLLFLGCIDRLTEEQSTSSLVRLLIDVKMPLVRLPLEYVSHSNMDVLSAWGNQCVLTLYADNVSVSWRAAQGPWTFVSVSRDDLFALAQDVFNCRIGREGNRIICRLFPQEVDVRCFRFDPQLYSSAANVLVAAYGGNIGAYSCVWFRENDTRNMLYFLATPADHKKAAETLKASAFIDLFVSD